MSILIKGMEMPKSCGNCYMFSFLSDSCRITNHVTEEMNDKMFDRRFDDCPLIPVPPHGRLGDLDALAVEMEDEHLGGYVGDSWREIRQIIAEAPTIIPAEEGET